MLPDRGNTPARPNPGAAMQQDALAVIADLRAQMEAVAQRVFDDRLRNRRPGGADSWDFNASSAGTAVCGLAYIPYPAYIEGVALAAYPAGNVTWDIQVARPGADLTTAVSVVGGSVSLTGTTSGTVAAGTAFTRPVEAGSWVMAYCTAMTTSTLSCAALVIRCL